MAPWSRSSWVGLLLSAAIALATAAQIAHSRREALEHARSRAELLARVLDEHAARSVDTVALSLAALAQTIGPEGADASPRIGQALLQALAGLPMLRAVAVLDAQGRVVTSTDAADLGAAVPLEILGPLPLPGADRVGRFVAGRGLRAAAIGKGDQTPRGVGFVPVVRLLGGPRPLLLVGLLNPDAIANHQTQILAAEQGAALLVGLDGQVIAATEAIALVPGDRVPALPAVERHRNGAERGVAIEPGQSGALAAVAFRASRSRPVLTQVELPLDAALATWKDSTRLVLGVAALAVLVVLAMARAAARSAKAQRLAQASVAARESDLRVLVGSVQELIFRTDAEGRLTFISPRWSDLSAAPPQQALGRPLADWVTEDSREAARRLFGAGEPMPGGSGRRALLTFASPDGERRFDVHVQALQEGGRLDGFAGSAVDVTERLASQQRLSEQLAFNERLLELLPLPVSMVDVQGRYVVVNQAWEAITGLRRERVLGLAARHFMDAELAELHARADRELLAGGVAAVAPHHDEISVQGQDHARHDLAITKAAVTRPDGKPAGVLMVSVDVTERRAAERAVLEARDAAEEASRAKSEFIANISHELRTPLQSIIGFSELGEHRGREASPKLAAMFGQIHQSGQRMLALVNDLLDVSRIESTVGTFHLERTDLRPLVREVARELSPLLATRRLHIEQDLGDLPLVAKVDPMRFQQVIRNVLANAIRFSPPGAAIDVTGELTAENQLHFRLRDRGPGIPPAELEKIFEAFVQSTRTKDGSGGTGLGLAICRKIVEAQGGSIRAAQAEGGGSVFTITLPARGFVETLPGVL